MRGGGSTKDWRAARALAFRTYGNACVKCGDTATEIDHIVELASGGTDDIENLQPLCTQCHKQKTSQFNSKRLTKKRKNNGFFWGQAPPTTLSLSYLSPRLSIEPPINQKKEKTPNDA